MGRSSMPTVFLLPALLLAALAASAKSLTLKPDCQASCGGVDIPYPFGIGLGCFRPGFGLTCVNNTTPVLGHGSRPCAIRVLNISVMPRPEARVKLHIAYQCYDVTGESTGPMNYGQVDFNKVGVYRMSSTQNDTFAYINSGPPGRYRYSYYAGCVAFCNNSQSAQDGACDGVCCCRRNTTFG